MNNSHIIDVSHHTGFLIRNRHINGVISTPPNDIHRVKEIICFLPTNITGVMDGESIKENMIRLSDLVISRIRPSHPSIQSSISQTNISFLLGYPFQTEKHPLIFELKDKFGIIVSDEWLVVKSRHWRADTLIHILDTTDMSRDNKLLFKLYYNMDVD